jgi:YbgC/YbaW family acyl-CoA thioester hydrolase
MPFKRDILVRFPDVDFARVVYYPRFFDYCHQVFEDFFAAEVGVPYAQMLQVRKVGYPSVHAESDFVAPLRFGDTATVEMTTEKVGQGSITLSYRVLKGGALCATLTVVSAAVNMDTFQGVNVPDDVRAAFERFR